MRQYSGDVTSGREPDLAVPESWPTAWRHLWPTALDRAGFVGAVVVLTAIGIAATGDLSVQWWAVVLPLALLPGPVSRPYRVRRSLQRAAAQGRLAAVPGVLADSARSGVYLAGTGRSVALPRCRVSRTLQGEIGQPALLVWVPKVWPARVPAAVVLDGPQVGYLDRTPRGAQGFGRSGTVVVGRTAASPALMS